MVTGWIQKIAREGELRCLVGDSRSSERDTEAFGHWLDTVDSQRRSNDMSGDWFDTVDR